MEKTGRIFVSSVLTDGMFRDIKAQGYKITCATSSLEELKNTEFISVFKNKALVNTLNKKGIKAVYNPIEITLSLGDTLYVLDPGGKIHDLGEHEILPDYMTITVGKYTINN